MRRRGYLWTAFLAGWIFCCGGAAFAGDPVELIDNGGFEDGVSGWTLDAKHELVTDAAAAHGGKACVTGATEEPNQALRIHRSVPVKAGNLYQFSIWARATKGAKLVLFATLPGSKVRTSIAAWKDVGRTWKKYTASITIQQSGTARLELIAPSSHGAPAGQIWIDDVSLLERSMPPVLDASEGVGFNDEPAMAAAADGTVTLAWNSFRDGADSLQVARYRPTFDGLQRLGAWQVVGGKGTYILGPAAVSAGTDVVVLYAAEVEGNWDIHAVTVGANGPGKPFAITTHAGVDIKPAAAWRDGTLWVAWESNRTGRRQVFATSVRDGQAAPPVAVSAAGMSSYAPSIAALRSGGVAVAWHGFREHNYDVFLRRRSAEGTWTPERRLTRAPTIDRHAVLIARGDELWIIYENATTTKYSIGKSTHRRLIAGKVTSAGLQTPTGLATSPLHARSEAASAVFDSDGRLWVAYLVPRLPRAGWDAVLTCYNGKTWQRPSYLAVDKGMDRRPGLAIAGGRVCVAFQTDDIAKSWTTVELTSQAKSVILLADVEIASAPRAVEPAIEPFTESDEVFEAAAIRIERGEDAPTPTITYQGETLKLFYGDLHEHTDVSVCNRVGDQTIDESYQHMRDLVSLDFACVTDHGYNLNPYLWYLTAKLARANEDARYLTFLGEEWTSSFEKYSVKHPYGYYGHHNVILADTYFPRWWNSRNGQTPADVWEDLRKLNANFVLIPHQLADTGNVPTAWEYTDETAQPVAEIFQTRGSYEYKGTVREAKRSTPKRGYFIQDAWARGIVIGVIASPDHGGGYGKACVYAKDLTREAILDALRKRRCFGTSAARIFLDVRVDGHLMGEKVVTAPGKTVEIKVATRCPMPIARIDICRNNQFIYTKSPKAKAAEFTFTDRDPVPGRSYYYVRVIQEDEEIAWSSPIWLGAK